MYILFITLVQLVADFHSILARWRNYFSQLLNVKGKAIPLHAWTGPEGSRRLRLPNSRQSAHESAKFVSPTHQPPLPPGIIPGTHFC
jgi:hypothetical protein